VELSNSTSGTEIALLFKTITDKVNSHRFIGAIQLNKEIQYTPEQKTMMCDIIKFHVHTTESAHQGANSSFDGISSLEIVFLHDSDLVII
jgi:hypothetical protein